jgi:hypothetical protein
MTWDASMWPVKLRVTGARAETPATRAAIKGRIVVAFILIDSAPTRSETGIAEAETSLAVKKVIVFSYIAIWI